jgi:hypothetical protein
MPVIRPSGIDATMKVRELANTTIISQKRSYVFGKFKNRRSEKHLLTLPTGKLLTISISISRSNPANVDSLILELHGSHLVEATHGLLTRKELEMLLGARQPEGMS